MLEDFKMLDCLEEKDKKKLELFCQKKSIKIWEILFKEWEEANSMYFLKKWWIIVYKTINWEKIILWNIYAEEIIWEMALFWTNWKRMWTAEALEDCELVTVASFSIKELAKKNNQLLLKIQKVIEERNIKNKKIEDYIK